MDHPIHLTGHYGWVELLQSSPDGQWFVTACSRYVRFWHLPTVLAQQARTE